RESSKVPLSLVDGLVTRESQLEPFLRLSDSLKVPLSRNLGGRMEIGKRIGNFSSLISRRSYVSLGFGVRKVIREIGKSVLNFLDRILGDGLPFGLRLAYLFESLEALQ